MLLLLARGRGGSIRVELAARGGREGETEGCATGWLLELQTKSAVTHMLRNARMSHDMPIGV